MTQRGRRVAPLRQRPWAGAHRAVLQIRRRDVAGHRSWTSMGATAISSWSAAFISFIVRRAGPEYDRLQVRRRARAIHP